MPITRHRVDHWIKNNSVDVSVKDISGDVSVHWHEFYEIEVILSGGGIYNIDGIEYPIRRGNLFFMNPGSFHRIQFEDGTRLINIMFTPEVCNTQYLCSLFDQNPHLTLELSEEELPFFQILAADMQNRDPIKYLSASLNCILAKIHKLASNSHPILPDSAMQYALLYIQNNFTENITLKSAATVANYSPNYFSNKFKAYTGVSFKNYLLELRLSFAKKLLCNTDLSVTQICAKCGFSDFSNFLLYFKKRYLETPSQFRRAQEQEKNAQQES